MLLVAAELDYSITAFVGAILESIREHAAKLQGEGDLASDARPFTEVDV